MKLNETESEPRLADLLDLAIATAHPDRASLKDDDYTGYRLPLDRLAGVWSEDHAAVSVDGTIRWNAALQTAYRDGYDPILWLGRGASAEVWRCVDRAIGREVALKIPVLEPGQGVDPAVAALQDEAELLGRLHHPGIVHAVRRSGEGRSAYLALEFIDGDDLFEHSRLLDLDATGRLTLFLNVLDAASYLHGKGIVHGDLKPDHLLVREDGQPVMIDFGLSSYDSPSDLRIDEQKRIGGSGMYRAPEIANGLALASEPQHDVYSLGIILRELMKDTDLGDCFDQIHGVIQRATEEEALDRWADAGQMLAALRKAIRPRSLEAEHQPAEASKPAHKTTQSITRYKIVYLAAALIVAFLSVGWFVTAEPDPEGGHSESHEIDRRQALSQRAALFEAALFDIYAGNTGQAQERIQSVADPAPESSADWEVRYLEAMVAGVGLAHPFGEQPYDAPHALCAAYDPASESMVYARRGEHDDYELWVQRKDGPSRLVSKSIEVIRSVAISRGGDRVATIEVNNRVAIYPLQDEDTARGVTRELPLRNDARAIWFSRDGQSLYVFSPRARIVEQWPVVGAPAQVPAAVINECDHAYTLASGEGSFLVATAGENRSDGLTQLRQISPTGAVTRTLELEDGQLPASADTRPEGDAAVCLGMPNGYVRIYSGDRGGWQPHCDLGLNTAVPAVVYSEVEQRTYAAMGRVHVIDATGNLVLRLGDRNANQQLITDMAFDESTSTLTCLSVQDVWQCIAARNEN